MSLYSALSTKRPNFPTQPTKKLDYKSFPNDLAQQNRNFFFEINFMAYNITSQITTPTIYTSVLGGLRLPIPRKLVDNQTVSWGEQSATSVMGSTALAAGGVRSFGRVGNFLSTAIGGSKNGIEAVLGHAVNPLFFLFFQRPNYKEYSFSWSFAPENEKESKSLEEIIAAFKKHQLPTNLGYSLKYPDLAVMKIFTGKNNEFFDMKPCIIQSVQVDYTPAGGPAFLSDGKPSVVTLSVAFKEIQLRDQLDGTASGGETIQGYIKQVQDLF